MSKQKDKTELGGLFGESVTVRKVNNRVVVKNRSKRNGKKRKLTANEIAQRERFQKASRYASSVHADEALNALYSKRIRGKYESAYTVALADFHNAPKIRGIEVRETDDASHEFIRVDAIDDFMVVRVTVRISAPDGSVIEKGEAVEDKVNGVDRWNYTPTIAQPLRPGMKIIASAYDRPGNETVKELMV